MAKKRKVDDADLWISAEVRLNERFDVYPVPLRERIRVAAVQQAQEGSSSVTSHKTVWEVTVVCATTPVEEYPTMPGDQNNKTTKNTSLYADLNKANLDALSHFIDASKIWKDKAECDEEDDESNDGGLDLGREYHAPSFF